MKYSPARETVILKAIADHAENYGYPISLREICESTGIHSTSIIQRYLVKMRDKGLVDWDFNKSRTLRICNPPRNIVE